MAKNTIDRGTTSVIRHVFVQDSTLTTGAGKTGLAFNTASISAYYIYPGGTATALTLETITTLGTYAAPTSAAHMRFKEVDATNMPGIYEVQFHNDWFSVASARVGGVVQMKGAANMAQIAWEFDLIGFALQNTNPPVDVVKLLGTAWLAPGTAGTPDVNAKLVGGQTASAAGAVTFPGTIASTTNITAATGITVATNNDKTGYGLSSAAVQAVWDALTSALTTVGSIGKRLVDLFAGISVLAHWIGMLAGKQAANSTALTEIKATGAGSGTYDPTTDSLEAERDNIGTAGAGLTAADDATITAIAALNNLSAAQVNAEVVDAINVDTYAEPGQGAPAATLSLVGKIGYLYKAWRNKKTQTATTFSLFNDDAATVDQKAATSDDTVTGTVGEIASGP